MIRWFGQKERERARKIKPDVFLEEKLALLSHLYIVSPKWLGMNDSPGRQFTASFHPIAEIGSWYNPKIRRSLYIGVHPDVWMTLRRCQKRGKNQDSPLGILTRDALRLICRQVWILIAEEARRKLIE